MRVLYFTRGYSPHDRRFLTALAQTEHTIHYQPLCEVDSIKAGKELPAEIHQEAALQASDSLSWLRYPAMVKKLRRRLDELHPDLVHAGPIHSCAALAALSGFHPLVSMSWGSDLLLETRDPRVSTMARYTLRRTDAFVGDCETVVRAAVKFGMDGKRVVQFPWGIDLQHFSPGDSKGIREELGWQDRIILLSTRSFEPIYGVDLVVKAFLQIAERQPESRLLLLGDGSQKTELEEMAARSSFSAKVHFAGKVELPELPEYYRAADLFVSASYSDGSSVSLLEAMGCGLPVIVSDIPSNQEWVVQGENGWVFRSGDRESLANIFEESFENRSALDELGKAARKVVERRANWKANFPRLLEAYSMALQFTGESPS